MYKDVIDKTRAGMEKAIDALKKDSRQGSYRAGLGRPAR